MSQSPQRGEHRAIPRNPILGYLSDSLRSIGDSFDSATGTTLGSALTKTKAELLDNSSHGFHPYSGTKLTTTLDPDTPELLDLIPSTSGLSSSAKALYGALTSSTNAIPTLGGILVGASAKLPSYILDDLDIAKEAISSTRLPPDRIRDATGWHPNTYGGQLPSTKPDWEYDRPDQDLDILSEPYTTKPYDSAISFPSAQSSYPDLTAEHTFSRNPDPTDAGKQIRGGYDYETKTIETNPDFPLKEQASNVLHETSHAIQREEGWPSGGTPGKIPVTKDTLNKITNIANDQLTAIKQHPLASNLSYSTNPAIEAQREVIRDAKTKVNNDLGNIKFQTAIFPRVQRALDSRAKLVEDLNNIEVKQKQSFEDALAGRLSEKEHKRLNDSYKEKISEFSDQIDKLDKTINKNTKTVQGQLYKALAGEAQARGNQAQAAYNMDDRRMFNPADFLDVKPENQILQYLDSNSLPKP